jgi:hypothetical protein
MLYSRKSAKCINWLIQSCSSSRRVRIKYTLHTSCTHHSFFLLIKREEKPFLVYPLEWTGKWTIIEITKISFSILAKMQQKFASRFLKNEKNFVDAIMVKNSHKSCQFF